MKTTVISELDELIYWANQMENVILANKIANIKKLLLEEWNASDMYMEEIKQALNYDAIMNDLNNL